MTKIKAGFDYFKNPSSYVKEHEEVTSGILAKGEREDKAQEDGGIFVGLNLYNAYLDAKSERMAMDVSKMGGPSMKDKPGGWTETDHEFGIGKGKGIFKGFFKDIFGIDQFEKVPDAPKKPDPISFYSQEPDADQISARKMYRKDYMTTHATAADKEYLSTLGVDSKDNYSDATQEQFEMIPSIKDSRKFMDKTWSEEEWEELPLFQRKLIAKNLPQLNLADKEQLTSKDVYHKVRAYQSDLYNNDPLMFEHFAKVTKDEDYKFSWEE